MMDEDTLTIGYRDWRGEPRGKLEKAGQDVEGNGAQTHGDCIDCMACVNVCPQGIDIRDGQQLACITCGLCIDACNGIMDKIGKPRDLIGYLALTDEVAERAGAPKKSLWRHILRLRTVVYTVLWAGVGAGLIVALFLRAPLDVNVTPVRNPQYVTLADGSIRNAYDLRLRNMQGDDRVFAVSASSAIATFFLAFDGQDDLNITVPANQTKTVRLFVTAPVETLAVGAERTDLRLWIMDMGPDGSAVDPLRIHYDTVFYGAEKDHDDDDGKDN
jgi:cytochrome c oxidase accessory protein FixG